MVCICKLHASVVYNLGKDRDRGVRGLLSGWLIVLFRIGLGVIGLNKAGSRRFSKIAWTKSMPYMSSNGSMYKLSHTTLTRLAVCTSGALGRFLLLGLGERGRDGRRRRHVYEH